MKSLKREFANLLFVVLLPALLVCIFPFDAVGFRSSWTPGKHSLCVEFVELSAEAEAEALQRAKASWQMEKGTRDDWHVQLRLEDLPGDGDAAPAIAFAIPNARKPTEVEYRLPAYLPSSGAKSPRILRGSGFETESPAFSREELLEINER